MLLRLALLISLAALAVTVAAAKPKTTMQHLSFYMHDIVTASPGRPATVGRMTTGTTALPGCPRTRFGDMHAVDDPLMEGPDWESPAVGRAQGFYLFAYQTEPALMVCFNVVFTAGPHNGSTIAVVSRDLVPDKVRELPVVGGTGAFRCVTGYGLMRTQAHNASEMNAVLKVDVYLRIK